MIWKKSRSRSFTYKKMISILLASSILTLIHFITWMPVSHAFEPLDKMQEVVDLATVMHIAAVGNMKQDDVYVIGRTQELCLLFTNGTSGMWNPELDKLVVSPGPLCTLPNGAKPLNRIIPLMGEDESLPTALTGPVIYHIYDASIDANCGSILGDHYVIFYPDGHSYSFYLIGRLSKPETFTKFSMCDYMMGKTETVHVAWTGKISTNYVAFSGNRVIMYDYNFNQHFVRQTVIMIPPLMGDQVTSIAHLTYIIPMDRLEPLLNKVGFDPVARNEVLQNFIQSLPQGHADIP